MNFTTVSFLTPPQLSFFPTTAFPKCKFLEDKIVRTMVFITIELNR